MGQWVVGRLSLATLLLILAFQQFIVSTLLQQQQKAPCGIFEILPTQFDYIDIILWDCSRIQQMITSSCVLNFSCVHSWRHYQDSSGMFCQHGGPCRSESGACGTPRDWQVQHDPLPHNQHIQDRPQSNCVWQLHSQGCGWPKNLPTEVRSKNNLYKVLQSLGHRRKGRDPQRYLLQSWRRDGLLSSCGIWWKDFKKVLRWVVKILQTDFSCRNKDRAEGWKRESNPDETREGAGEGGEWGSLSWVLRPKQWWLRGRSVQRGGQKGFSKERSTG